RLRQPMAGKGRITGSRADFFQQLRIRLRVALPGVMCLRDRVLVVRILDQSLDQCLRFPRVHIIATDANTRPEAAATRAYCINTTGPSLAAARQSATAPRRHSKRP